jgi:hypothetical protein
MRGLAESRVETFARRMTDRLRDVFAVELAEQRITCEQLSPIVRQAMADAANYGVIGEMDLELYIDCIAMLGVGFDRGESFPWVSATLQRTDIDGTGKMGIIHDYLIFASGKAR